MKPILVWDLPTRLFHGLLAVGFLVAFGIAQFGGEHSSLFPIHALLGLVLGFMWLLRILWGFVGTRYARFDSFTYRPGEVLRYTKDALIGRARRYVGHNPGSSAAALAMFVLLPGIVVTGLLMGGGNEWAEELHQLLAYAMIAVVLVHLLGLALHTIRHRENIALSMVNGLRAGDPPDAIRSARPLVAVAFLLLTALWAGGLYRNYDVRSGQTVLPVVGGTVHLTESGHGASENAGEDHDHEGGEDHDD
jgi:cytochrome b